MEKQASQFVMVGNAVVNKNNVSKACIHSGRDYFGAKDFAVVATWISNGSTTLVASFDVEAEAIEALKAFL